MIFNILSVTIASVLGCLLCAPTCGGPSLAFTCLCAGAAVPGALSMGSRRVQLQTLPLWMGQRVLVSWCPAHNRCLGNVC